MDEPRTEEPQGPSGPRRLHPVTFLKGEGTERDDSVLYPDSLDLRPKYTPVDAADKAPESGQSD